MDSLITGYDRYKDLSATFQAKATKTQTDLESRARSLENQMSDLNTKASKGLMTRSDIEATQTQIQTRAQQFDADRQTQLAGLDEEQMVMTNQVMFAITEYVAKFNADLRYKMILTSSGSSPVMHADPALNITAEILKGLNEEYAAEKKSGGAK
jgi:outer membrane protein